MKTLETSEIVSVFALSEEEQEQYFPQFENPVHVDVGATEITTSSARFVALCTLAYVSKGCETEVGELGIIYSEIASLSNLMIEISGFYDWLILHPSAVKTTENERVDPSIYGVWGVIRRLCKETSLHLPSMPKPRPFMQVFAPVMCARG